MSGRAVGRLDEAELFGFFLGQQQESVVQVGDPAADLGGVEAVAVGD